MLLRKINDNWHKIEKIGIDAQERGRKLGLTPSWASDDDDDADDNAPSVINVVAARASKLVTR